MPAPSSARHFTREVLGALAAAIDKTVWEYFHAVLHVRGPSLDACTQVDAIFQRARCSE